MGSKKDIIDSWYVKVVFGLLAFLLIAGIVFTLNNSRSTIDTTVIEPQASEVKDTVAAEPQAQIPEPVKPQPLFDKSDVETTVQEWEQGANGSASVVIFDADGEEVVATAADDIYFGASLYKLYVAYYGYQQVDEGLVDPSETYVNGHTRAECLDLMIRESDSPCAEKLWVELGKETVTSQLSEIGIQNTTMSDIRTTAADAARMLALISEGTGLSEESHADFLLSMKEQVYRDTLNKGFSDAVTVYNKIGFRELDEYHDVAIVEVADGRRFILSVLTDGVGTQNIADLATQIEDVILE